MEIGLDITFWKVIMIFVLLWAATYLRIERKDMNRTEKACLGALIAAFMTYMGLLFILIAALILRILGFLLWVFYESMVQFGQTMGMF